MIILLLELVQLDVFLQTDLTTNPNIKVLLLEAGGKDTNPWIHIPGGYFKTMHNPNTDWCFKTEKEPNL